MKYLRTIVLYGGCFLLAAAATCVFRTKYSTLPRVRTSLAFNYADNVRRYSFLQYTQAGPQQGKTALLQFVNLLQRIRHENIIYPANELHNDLALAYLRVYRIESATGDEATANNYMKSAQEELLAEGAKRQRVSTEALAKLVEAHDAREAAFYNQTEIPSDQNKSDAPIEKHE